MKIETKKASDLFVNKWAGGTTTQLAIYPNDSSYTERNFLFRISTATVETEESTFTKLPGVSRKLMILDGEIKIEHKGHHSKRLKKFEQDEFSGDWNTKSFGKATDFNLMLRENTQGSIEAITLSKNYNQHINPEIDYYGIYMFSGKIQAKANKETYTLEKGDSLSIYPENKELKISLLIEYNVELIITKIKF